MLTSSQLKERVSYLGGSDISCIFSLNKYRSAYDVYLEKIGEAIKQPRDERTITPIDIGNAMEAGIIDLYRRKTGFTVERVGLKLHPEYSFIGANIDGLVTDNEGKQRILEVKTSSYQKAGDWGREGTDEINTSYLLQVATYVMVYGLDKADIAVLFNGRDFKVYTYTRNTQLEDIIIARAKAFWDCVQNKTPPLASNVSEVLDVLKRKSEGVTPASTTTAKASEEVLAIHSRLKEITAQTKVLSEEEEKLRYKLVQYMGDALSVENESGSPIARIIYVSRAAIDSSKLKSEYPEAYEAVTKTATTNYLKVI